MEEVKKRKRRTQEEIIAALDEKIAKHKEDIRKLEEKKDRVLHPKKRMTKAAAMKVVMEKAKKAGMTPEEIAEKLGLLDEE